MMDNERIPPQPAQRQHNEKIAIVGAGPCGLTAAQDLVLSGYGVTVFESLPIAGGMLRIGVPEYRLPADIIEREVADIIDLGVDLRLNTAVENIDDLLADGYSAVLVSVGAHEGNRLPIPGNDLDGILINTVFLRDVRLHQLDSSARDPGPVVAGKRVVVIGGGDVAMDVARTARRLGAADVQIAMREREDAIPASPEEVVGAREENIGLHTSINFLSIKDDGSGNVAGVECQRVNRFDIDENGRWIADVIEGSGFIIDADVVVFSVGQKAGLSLIPEASDVKVNANNTLDVNPNTFATGRPGIFAAGDAVSGTAFVIEAVATGHGAARSIASYLRGEDMDIPEAERPIVSFTQQQLDTRVLKGEIVPALRVQHTSLPLDNRDGFEEVDQCFSKAEAMAEAARWLTSASAKPRPWPRRHAV